MPIPFALKKLLVRTGAARFLPAARRLTDGGTEYLRYYSDRGPRRPRRRPPRPGDFPRTDRPGRGQPERVRPRGSTPRRHRAGRRATEAGGRRRGGCRRCGRPSLTPPTAGTGGSSTRKRRSSLPTGDRGVGGGPRRASSTRATASC